MYCTQQQFCACQCLPQRLKPQTAKPVSALLFSVVSIFKAVVFESIFSRPCLIVPFFHRAKNLVFIGLLALFFCVHFRDNLIKEIL